MNSSRTTSAQLFQLAEKYGIPLNDICTKDHLKFRHPLPGGYIVNMQDSTEGNGTHWVAIWLSRNKKDPCCYFDSFGIDPPLDIIDFCAQYNKKILLSTEEIQNINGGHCGQYCIDFLRHMMLPGSIEKKYRYFTNNY